MDEIEEDNGLYAGHAYSLLRAEEVHCNNGDIAMLVRIRNPWGEHEWTRDWSDECPKWNLVSNSEKKRIHFTEKDDGGFWMTFKDWCREFEKFTICLLPLP